jgi:hypothetical protein
VACWRQYTVAQVCETSVVSEPFDAVTSLADCCSRAILRMSHLAHDQHTIAGSSAKGEWISGSAPPACAVDVAV